MKGKLTDPFIAPLPQDATEYPRGLYNCFPVFTPTKGDIFEGYGKLAKIIEDELTKGLRVLVIDGYHGVDWDSYRNHLSVKLMEHNIDSSWIQMRYYMVTPEEIHRLVEPFLGGDDPLFGTHFPLGPEIFFNPQKLAELRIKTSIAREKDQGELTIIYGTGAGLIELWDSIWYMDIPKDVIQNRARTGEFQNFGEIETTSFSDFYKRSYFVDWPVLNRLKCKLLPEINYLIDLQVVENPVVISGNDFRESLYEISESPFRVRPWFFPGPWGGKYMQGHIGLNPDKPNFAWSFELISPENGIVLNKNGKNLEFSFDYLMYQENKRVLGENAARKFKYQWPIRLDYLDTINGGNLSVQCHPRPKYIRERFGETYTQDEAYYISNAKPNAKVYIGLIENCDPIEFRKKLERSEQNVKGIDIDKFVNSVPSKPHDMFLIPNGTVHCSGEGNLVLEISATPYIFTFKMYDYLRVDLDGKLRTLNIERAFENIRFERREKFIKDNYLVKPKLLQKGDDWKEYELYNRPETFYHVHRIEFYKEFEISMEGKAFAINCVEGETVKIISKNEREVTLSLFESMVIPAATEKVKIVNMGKGICKLIMVFIRKGIGGIKVLNRPWD